MGKFSQGVTTYFSANIKGFRTGFQNAGREVKSFSRSMKKSLGGIKKTFGTIGTLVGAGILFQGFKQMASVFREFEVQTDKLSAVLGITGDEMTDLIEDAKRLGATTQFTAKQVAELQTEFAKFGLTRSEILSATEATLNLAAATGSDLSNAATVAAGTLRGFGMDASQMTRLTDVMAKSFSTSALDLDKFQESMKYVAPVAKAAGLSVEETTAMLGKLADSGISGSQAGTALRRILSEMAATGKPASEALREVAERGVTLASAQDEVGRSAQTALLVLSEQITEVDRLTETFENASGAAAEMAETMLDNWSGDLTKLSSAWEGVVLSFEDGSGRIGTALRTATQFFTGLLTDIQMIEKYGGMLGFGELEQTQETVKKTGQYVREKMFGEIESGSRTAEKAISDLESQIEKLQAKATDDSLTTQLRFQFDQLAAEYGRIINEINASLNVGTSPASGGAPTPIRSQSTAATVVPKELTDPIPSNSFLKTAPDELDKINWSMQRIAENKAFDKWLKEFGKVAIELNDVMVGVGQTLTSVFENVIVGITSGGQSMGDILSGILGIVASFIGQFGKMLIGAALASQAFASLLVNPFAALAAGLALVGLSAAIKGFLSQGFNGGGNSGGGGRRTPALASGGLAFGQTLAIVGDNTNAMSDPEVIAPLSQLKKYIGNGGGSVDLVGTTKLVGRDIFIAWKKANNDEKRIR